jgi:hypothetical protein
MYIAPIVVKPIITKTGAEDNDRFPSIAVSIGLPGRHPAMT